MCNVYQNVCETGIKAGVASASSAEAVINNAISRINEAIEKSQAAATEQLNKLSATINNRLTDGEWVDFAVPEDVQTATAEKLREGLEALKKQKVLVDAAWANVTSSLFCNSKEYLSDEEGTTALDDAIEIITELIDGASKSTTKDSPKTTPPQATASLSTPVSIISTMHTTTTTTTTTTKATAKTPISITATAKTSTSTTSVRVCCEAVSDACKICKEASSKGHCFFFLGVTPQPGVYRWEGIIHAAC